MNYRRKVHLDAAPGAIYAALTTRDGLSSWWTTECEVEPGVGGRLTFHFGGSRVGVQLEEAKPNRKIVWRCIDHHFEGMSPVDEWVGTRMIFRLEPTANGTQLDFVHEGLVPRLACWEACNAGWDRNLLTSLKQYVETGKGEPYQVWLRRQAGKE